MTHFRIPLLLSRLGEPRLPTPFYAYDPSVMQESFHRLKNAFPESFTLLYSMKANPHPRILRSFKELGTWIDVSSLEELRRARDAGFSPFEISFIGPGKSDEELEVCVRTGISSIVVESLTELELLQQIASTAGKVARVCLRVNPRRYIAHSGIERNAQPSQFGLDEELLESIPAVLSRCPSVHLVGLHFYLHSQFLRSADLAANFRSFLGIASDFQSRLGSHLEMINLGGGFGIPYFDGQSELDLAELKVALTDLFHSAAAAPLAHTRFFVESGRFLVGPSGVFVTRVLYRKSSRGKTFLICDGGLTQHLAATGVGQVIRRNYPVFAIRAHDDSFHLLHQDEPLEKVQLAGPSCYSLDILGQDILLPRLERGDLICFAQSGAYGPSFSPQNFLGRPPAAEIFLEDAVEGFAPPRDQG